MKEIISQDPDLPQGFSVTFKSRFWNKVDKNGPIPERFPEIGQCWIWTSWIDKDGYGAIEKGSASSIRAHRASWLLENGAIPDGMCVLHRCDNPKCVRPSHLWLGTNRENIADRDKKGRTARQKGEDSGLARLTEVEVVEIRTSVGLIPAEILASRYGVCAGHINNIRSGKRWKHLLNS